MRNMLRPDILYDSVGATFDMLECSIWPNAAVFNQFSVILDMRPHHRWVFIALVVSHTLCKDRFDACHKITPLFINQETCLITAFNKLRPFSEHVITKLSSVPVWIWVIEQHAIMLSATVRSPTVIYAPINWVIIGSDNGCRLLNAQLLPKPVLTYWQLGRWEQMSPKSETRTFYCNDSKITEFEMIDTKTPLLLMW